MIYSRTISQQDSHFFTGGTMVTDPALMELLKKLAAEDGITIEALIEKMAKNEDVKRHVIFHTEERHIRVKCGRMKCFETRIAPKDNIRD